MPEPRSTGLQAAHDPASGVSEAPPSHHLRGYLLAAFAAACWATGGLTAKWMFTRLGTTVDPAQLSGARALLAAVLLIGFLALRAPRELLARPRDLPFFAVFGVFGLAMVHFTYFKAISLTNVATAILLEYLAPVLILLFSVAFLSERFTWSLPTAVAMSVAGCALMVGVIGGAGLSVSPAGIAWGLASAVFFALYTVLGKYAAHRFSQWTLLAYGLGAASVFWLVLLGPTAVFGVLADPGRFAAVFFMAVVGTIAPFAAFLTALHHIDATKASVTATLEPGIAALAAFLLLGESLLPLQLLGGGLVLAAILVVQLPGRPVSAEDLPPAA
jgi:drug/metabolite transporter (DMT)-like permease